MPAAQRSRSRREGSLLVPALRLIVYVSAVEVVVFAACVLLLKHFDRLSLFDALYLAVTTLTTVGYGDIHPVTAAGRAVAMFLAVTGLGYVWLSLSIVVATLVEGHVIRFWGEIRMERRIARLKNHVIVCGLGRAGMAAIRQLEREGAPFVGIDLDERQVESLRERGHLAIVADATEDETLKAAGVERARSLIATLPHDPANILIAMAAKELNPGIRVVARADRPENIKRLKRAGADWVTAVGIPAGARLALAALKPVAVDFVAGILERRSPDYKLEELLIEEGSPFAGRSIRESRLKEDYSAQVLAIVRGDRSIVNPEATEEILPGDVVIIFGAADKLAQLDATPGIAWPLNLPRGPE